MIEWVLRLGLGALMIYAGVIKLGDPTQFAVEITNYRFLPSLAPWMAVVVPFVEIVLGVALMVAPREWRRAAALGTAGLMTVFTVAVAQVVARGIDVECGCFGSGSGPVTMVTVWRDVVLVVAALVLLWIRRPTGENP